MKNFERLGVLGFRFLKAAIMFVNHTDVHNTYVEPSHHLNGGVGGNEQD